MLSGLVLFVNAYQSLSLSIVKNLFIFLVLRVNVKYDLSLLIVTK